MKHPTQDQYTILLDGHKTAHVETIYQQNIKANNNTIKTSKTPLIHERTDIDLITLIVETSIAHSQSFAFKLISPEWDTPFFRYDSAGPAHHNVYDDIPKKKKKVDTPHFHGYIDGRAMAYQSENLKLLIQNENATDINSSFECFCGETNISNINNKIPVIVPRNLDEMDLHVDEVDPLENVRFA